VRLRSLMATAASKAVALQKAVRLRLGTVLMASQECLACAAEASS
jgi:hypothetical protein